MAGTNYEKYLVRQPVYHKRDGQPPTMTYMSNQLVPGCHVYIELGWVNGLPGPETRRLERTHDYDAVLMFIGGDPYHPEDLGGEMEYYLGGQSLTFDTTSVIYVPRGVPHGSLTRKRVDKPYLEVAVIFGGVKTGEGSKPYKELPRKKGDINFEKYLVKAPLYQEDRRTIKDGRGPVTVYMCNDLIPEVNLYIDYVWIFTVPPPHIFEHVHDKYNEVVLHIGGTPDNPEDLGAEIEYYVSGQPLLFDQTTALYVPKGLKHGPLNWKNVTRPHLQMPIIIGAGSMAQAMPGGYQVK